MSVSIAIEWAGRSDAGKSRQQNEDAFAGALANDGGAADERGFFIVCDGMGGHAEGRRASELAVGELKRELARVLAEPPSGEGDFSRQLTGAVLAANEAIFQFNERTENVGRQRAGTTLALLLIAAAKAWIVHVGDSRVYQVTPQSTRLLTEDHNVGNREIRHGIEPEMAWKRGDADHLTQALGPFPGDSIRPDVRCLPVDEAQLFLLCSDGVSDNDFVERNEKNLLSPLLDAGADLAEGCARLLRAADEANGHDNVTAILVRVSIKAEAGPSRDSASDVTTVSDAGLLHRFRRFLSRTK